MHEEIKVSGLYLLRSKTLPSILWGVLKSFSHAGRFIIALYVSYLIGANYQEFDTVLRVVFSISIICYVVVPILYELFSLPIFTIRQTIPDKEDEQKD